MKVKKLFNAGIITVSVLCLAGNLAYASDFGQRGPISFDMYDINKDGYISESEFYEVRAERQNMRANQGMPMRNMQNAPEFNVFDKNQDGKLTKLELLEGQNEQMQNNRSNKGMGQGRMNNQPNNMKGMRNMPTFESFDLNGDGYLTESEMNEARENRMQQNAQQGKLMRNVGNYMPFSTIDSNSDGKVSKQEFLENQSRRR